MSKGAKRREGGKWSEQRFTSSVHPFFLAASAVPRLSANETETLSIPRRRLQKKATSIASKSRDARLFSIAKRFLFEKRALTNSNGDGIYHCEILMLREPSFSSAPLVCSSFSRKISSSKSSLYLSLLLFFVARRQRSSCATVAASERGP